MTYLPPVLIGRKRPKAGEMPDWLPSPAQSGRVIRDLGYAARLVEFCGPGFDLQVWAGWVDPEVWHGN
jgi:hypothetical protein